MYDKNFNVSNSTKVNSDSCKSKDLWITDYILLQNVNKIALCFTTKEIGWPTKSVESNFRNKKKTNILVSAIYEMTTKLDFNCQYRITHLNSIPLCIDYWYLDDFKAN